MKTREEFRGILDAEFPDADKGLAKRAVETTQEAVKPISEAVEPTQEAVKPTPEAVESTPEAVEPTPKAAERAVVKIENTWIRYRFHKGISSQPHSATVALHSDETDATLSQHMFGMTNAPYDKRGALNYLPENPDVSQAITSEIGYYRTDPLYALGDLREIIKSYEDEPEYTKYDYIPVTLSKSLSIDAIIDDYASEYRGKVQVIRHKTDPDNPMALIRVPRSETRFFLLKKALTTFGFYSGSFESKVAGLGIKSSHWQIALHKPGVGVEKSGATALDERLKFPETVKDLKESPIMQRLMVLSKNAKSPTRYLAATLLHLINKLPDNKQINSEAIKRIARYIDLGTTLYKRNYDKFAYIVYCVIHELTLLLNKKEITVDYEELCSTAKSRTSAMFGLSADDPKLRYIAFPANSGTNALMLALDIARKANKYDKERTSVRSEGPMYYEFASLRLQQVTNEAAEHDVYLITSGPTVWKGIYPGSDLNKFIKSRMNKGRGADKPMTLIVDSTSGMHRNLKLDPEVKEYIKQGKLSIIVNESHQKFGLAHSDQAQHGYVFGVCHTDMYQEEAIAEYEANSKADLQQNVDMQIGSYLTLCAQEPLERIKERHFSNGHLLRDFFKKCKFSEENFIVDSNSSEDPDKGLFVYVNAFSSVGKLIIKHFEHRNSFGHFNTTYCDCGLFIRLCVTASDKIDVYIEASELYFASVYSKKQLVSELSVFVKNNLSSIQEPSVSEQIEFIGMLQTLLHMNYKPKTLVEQFEWNFAIKYMKEHCPNLTGRKSYQHLLEVQEKTFKQATSSSSRMLEVILFRFSRVRFPFEKASELLTLVKEYEAAKKSKQERKNMPSLLAAMILLSRGQSHPSKEELLSNPSLSKAIIVLEEGGAFSLDVYSFLKRKDIPEVYYEAIALMKSGPITPNALNFLIKTDNQNYAKSIVIYYKVEALLGVVDQRIKGFKASEYEKSKLEQLKTDINQLKTHLESDLLSGKPPNFSDDKYTKSIESFADYSSFVQESKSTILKRIGIILSNLIARILNFRTQAGPSRTEVKEAATDALSFFRPETDKPSMETNKEKSAAEIVQPPPKT